MLKMLAASLLLTLLFEEGLALLWGLRGRRELGLVALVNCLTNPPAALLRWAGRRWLRLPNLPLTLALEALAVLTEWLCYRRGSEALRRPFLFALLANILSYGAGRLLGLIL